VKGSTPLSFLSHLKPYFKHYLFPTIRINGMFCTWDQYFSYPKYRILLRYQQSDLSLYSSSVPRVELMPVDKKSARSDALYRAELFRKVLSLGFLLDKEMPDVLALCLYPINTLVKYCQKFFESCVPPFELSYAKRLFPEPSMSFIAEKVSETKRNSQLFKSRRDIDLSNFTCSYQKKPIFVASYFRSASACLEVPRKYGGFDTMLFSMLNRTKFDGNDYASIVNSCFIANYPLMKHCIDCDFRNCNNNKLHAVFRFHGIGENGNRVRIPSILPFSIIILASYYLGFLHDYIKKFPEFSTFMKGGISSSILGHYHYDEDYSFVELDYIKATDNPPVENIIEFVKSLSEFPPGLIEMLFGIWYHDESDFKVDVNRCMPSQQFDSSFRVSIHQCKYRLIATDFGFFVRRGFRMGMRGAFPVLCLLNLRLSEFFNTSIRFRYFVGDDALIYMQKKHIISLIDFVDNIFEVHTEKSKVSSLDGHIASYYVKKDHSSFKVVGRYKLNLFFCPTP